MLINNLIQVNTENTLTNFNGIIDNNNNNAFQNELKLEKDEKSNKTCGQKACFVIKIIILVILFLPIIILCVLILGHGGGGIPISGGSSCGDICDCCDGCNCYNCKKKRKKKSVEKNKINK